MTADPLPEFSEEPTWRELRSPTMRELMIEGMLPTYERRGSGGAEVAGESYEDANNDNSGR